MPTLLSSKLSNAILLACQLNMAFVSRYILDVLTFDGSETALLQSAAIEQEEAISRLVLQKSTHEAFKIVDGFITKYGSKMFSSVR